MRQNELEHNADVPSSCKRTSCCLHLDPITRSFVAARLALDVTKMDSMATSQYDVG